MTMTKTEFHIQTVGGSFIESPSHWPVLYWGGGVDAGIKWLEKIANDFTFEGKCTEQKLDLNFHGKYAY
jgi:hypothetical protein